MSLHKQNCVHTKINCTTKCIKWTWHTHLNGICKSTWLMSHESCDTFKRISDILHYSDYTVFANRSSNDVSSSFGFNKTLWNSNVQHKAFHHEDHILQIMNWILCSSNNDRLHSFLNCNQILNNLYLVQHAILEKYKILNFKNISCAQINKTIME